MKNAEAMVKEFHEKFGLTIGTAPGLPHQSIRNFRLDLIVEELSELEDAETANDLIGIADALGDMLYVIIGYAITYGIPITYVFAEIHRSNMTKVWPDGSVKKREDGKVLKPPTYSPADITGVLKRAGYGLGRS